MTFNLVATVVGQVHVSYFIFVWEVSNACILIVDNDCELHYCSQTEKYCMRNITFNTDALPSILDCDCTLCEPVSQKSCHYFVLL